jgi:nucleoid DNA-binding protein
MNPKKPKDFIKPTAETLELSESVVRDVIDFYWSNVRKALSDIEGSSITVTNLGTFKVRYKKISQLERKYQHYLDNLDEIAMEKMTFNKHALQNLSKMKLERLQLAREELEKEKERKLEVRSKRKAYVTNKDLES